MPHLKLTGSRSAKVTNFTTLKVLEGQVECLGYVLSEGEIANLLVESRSSPLLLTGAPHASIFVEPSSPDSICIIEGLDGSEERDCIRFDPDCRRLLSMMAAPPPEGLAHAAGLDGCVRCLVSGCQGSGKSTLSLALTNAALMSHQKVFLLDADPGQPLFGPPGVVSLWEIQRPQFVSDAWHLATPPKLVASAFAGTSPGADPREYLLAIGRCAMVYHSLCRWDEVPADEEDETESEGSTEASDEAEGEVSSPQIEDVTPLGKGGEESASLLNATLIVNTCGWTQGLGDQLLEGVGALTWCNLRLDLGHREPQIDGYTVNEGCCDFDVNLKRQMCTSPLSELIERLGGLVPLPWTAHLTPIQMDINKMLLHPLDPIPFDDVLKRRRPFAGYVVCLSTCASEPKKAPSDTSRRFRRQLRILTHFDAAYRQIADLSSFPSAKELFHGIDRPVDDAGPPPRSIELNLTGICVESYDDVGWSQYPENAASVFRGRLVALAIDSGTSKTCDLMEGLPMRLRREISPSHFLCLAWSHAIDIHNATLIAYVPGDVSMSQLSNVNIVILCSQVHMWGREKSSGKRKRMR